MKNGARDASASLWKLLKRDESFGGISDINTDTLSHALHTYARILAAYNRADMIGIALVPVHYLHSAALAGFRA